MRPFSPGQRSVAAQSLCPTELRVLTLAASEGYPAAIVCSADDDDVARGSDDMASTNGPGTRLGWAGTGRMGYELVSRLLRAGQDVAVYNRTRAKAEPLAELGATVVDSPADLAGRDIVFTMVAGPADFKEV